MSPASALLQDPKNLPQPGEQLNRFVSAFFMLQERGDAKARELNLLKQQLTAYEATQTTVDCQISLLTVEKSHLEAQLSKPDPEMITKCEKLTSKESEANKLALEQKQVADNAKQSVQQAIVALAAARDNVSAEQQQSQAARQAARLAIQNQELAERRAQLLSQQYETLGNTLAMATWDKEELAAENHRLRNRTPTSQNQQGGSSSTMDVDRDESAAQSSSTQSPPRPPPTANTTPTSSTSSGTGSTGASPSGAFPFSFSPDDPVYQALYRAITGQPAPSTPRSTPTRCKHCGTRPGSLKEIKGKAKAAIPKDKQDIWARFMRKVFLDCTGMQFVNHFEDYMPVSEEYAEAFKNRGNDGPMLPNNKYQLYFSFADAVPGKRVELQLQVEHELTREKIIAWFALLASEAHPSWGHHQPQILENGANETPEQIQARTSTVADQRAINTRICSRKQTKYNKCISSLPKLLSTPPTSPRAASDLQRIKTVLDELDAAAMSSDYTDDEDPLHRLHTYVPHYWRRVISDDMEILDKAIQGMDEKRDRTLISEHSTASDIPRCCYNQTFLSTLMLGELAELWMQDKKLDHFERYARAQEAASD
ncbi:hypothetical protein L218DRAFT_966578 [Marasmius fiardii PR-910]|nr:hypothetical protein L218DRAFT_966578 [Marasmius fiardii PR-910]